MDFTARIIIKKKYITLYIENKRLLKASKNIESIQSNIIRI